MQGHHVLRNITSMLDDASARAARASSKAFRQTVRNVNTQLNPPAVELMIAIREGKHEDAEQILLNAQRERRWVHAPFAKLMYKLYIMPLRPPVQISQQIIGLMSRWVSPGHDQLHRDAWASVMPIGCDHVHGSAEWDTVVHAVRAYAAAHTEVVVPGHHKDSCICGMQEEWGFRAGQVVVVDAFRTFGDDVSKLLVWQANARDYLACGFYDTFINEEADGEEFNPLTNLKAAAAVMGAPRVPCASMTGYTLAAAVANAYSFYPSRPARAGQRCLKNGVLWAARKRGSGGWEWALHR